MSKKKCHKKNVIKLFITVIIGNLHSNFHHNLRTYYSFMRVFIEYLHYSVALSLMSNFDSKIHLYLDMLLSMRK